MQLASLPRLERQELRGNWNAGEIVEVLLRTHVGAAPLSVSGWTAAHFARLRDLPSLRELSLRDTVVGDAVVAGLGELQQLRPLDVAGTAITATGLRTLNRALPRCEVAPPGCPAQARAAGEDARAWQDCSRCHGR